MDLNIYEYFQTCISVLLISMFAITGFNCMRLLYINKINNSIIKFDSISLVGKKELNGKRKPLWGRKVG